MRALRRSVALAALITGAWALQVSPVFAFTGTMVPGAGINGTVHDDYGTPGANGMSYGAVPRIRRRESASSVTRRTTRIGSLRVARVAAGSPSGLQLPAALEPHPGKRTPSSRCTTTARRADYRATGKPGDPHRHHDSGQHLAPLSQLSRREHRREFLGQPRPRIISPPAAI